MPLTDDEAIDAVLPPRAPVAPDSAPAITARAPSADDAAVEAALSGTKERASQNIAAATRMAPEQAAKVHKMARDAGLSPWAVEGNEALVWQDLTARKNRELIATNPVLATAIANNPAFADVAFDDMENADKISKAWDKGGFSAAARIARQTADRQQQIIDQGPQGRMQATPGGGRTWKEAGADTALDISKSAIGVGESVVGLADIPTGNFVGGALGSIGYDPKRTREILTELQSDPRQAADTAVQAAEGFTGTLKALYDSPMSAAGTIAESSLMSLGGAAAVRLFATRALAAAGVAAGSAEATALLTSPAMVTKLLAVSAASEGLMTTGSIQEQGRQANRAWSQTVLPAIAGGAGTALISFATGKLLPDAEVALATAGLAKTEARAGTLLAIGKGLAKTMFKEGMLEELPQSAQEQVWTNVALGKPWDEGVGAAAAAGMVAGMGQGGGMHLYSIAVSKLAGEQTQAESDGAALLSTMQHAAESLTLRRDPVAFSAFFQEVAGDNTVFVDREQLLQVFAEAKLDINEKLPSAAAQLNQATPEGIEIPIAELVTNLSGSGIEEQLVQHLRMEPNAMTIAEGNTKADEAKAFIEHTVEQIMGAKERSDRIAAELKEIEDAVAADVTGVGRTGKAANQLYGKVIAASYAVMTDYWNKGTEGMEVTPKMVREGWTNAKGVKRPGWKLGILGAPTTNGAATPGAATVLLGVPSTISWRSGKYTFTETRTYEHRADDGRISRTTVDEEGATKKEWLIVKKDGVEVWSESGQQHKDDDYANVTPQRAQEIANEDLPAGATGETTGNGTLTQGFSHGNAMLNVGLDVGATDRAQKIDAALVESELNKMGVTVLSGENVDGEYALDGQMVKELTYVPHLSRPLTEAEVNQLAVATGQEAIPQYVNGTGNLWGPNAAAWGAFNPEFFKDQTGVSLAEAQKPLAQSQSARRPTTKKAPEDHLGEVPLTVDYTKMEPEKNEQNMKLVAQYPGIRFKARKADGRVEEFIQHVTNNLLWLHDQIPAEIRQRSKMWYDGARAITDRWTAKYGKTDAQIAAILAVYSPQKDWFMNVSLAERTLDIVQNQQDTPWSPEMSAVADKILADEKFAMLRGAIDGKKLSELKDRLEQAAWLRTFDEAHNPRGHRLVTPEGGFIELATSVKGAEKKTGWPGFGTIIKALYVIDDGSPKMIDNALGGEHKVRSFYNNIFHPTSDVGFVTIDTHAVAAGLLRPLSGNSLEVSHNFGSSGSAISAATGMSGTYPYYQEAYRRAAAERGLLPREMQSITWEAVRELYTIGFKHDTAKMAVVDKLWSEYEKGKRDLDSVRAGILNLAGGVEQPSWVGRDSGISPEGWASTYTGELLGDSVPGRDTGNVDRGAGSRAAAGTAGSLYQAAEVRAGAVSGPVVGVHFSQEARPILSSSMWGTGLKGAEGPYVRSAKDTRLRHRIAFYVNTGNGIFPESGVGGVAHVATLTNLYDADADVLKIWRNNDDERARESAVLDAGFDGFLTRSFGRQGAAVLLGQRNMPVESLGSFAATSWDIPKELKDKAITAGNAVNTGKHITSLQSGFNDASPEAQAAALAEILKGIGKPHDAKTVAGFLEGRTGTEALAAVLAEQDVRKAVTERATIVPSAEIPAAKALAMELARNPRLISGQQTIEGWKKDLERIEPETAKQLDWSKFEAGKMYRKDALAATLWQGPARAPADVKRDVAYAAIVTATEAGPFDGGCVVTAQAIQQQLGGNMVALTRGGVAQHAAVEIDGTYYDFNGPASAQEILRRFAADEHTVVEAIRPLEAGDLPEAPRSDSAAKKIAKLLPDMRTVGPYQTGEMWQGREQWYYSALEVALKAAPAKVFGSGKAVAQWLRANAGKMGVKSAEIEATGITDWLETQGKVAQEQVVEFMAQGGVKIEEVVLGKGQGGSVVEIGGGWEARSPGGSRLGFTKTKTEAEAIVAEAVNTGKFEQHQLPGGENYREVLITLPSTVKPEDRGTAYERETGNDFRSSHYDILNILAHVRMNERTDANGKRVLFIEEIQSDWAQKGRKEGFNIFDSLLTPDERELRALNAKSWQGGMTQEEEERATELHNAGVAETLQAKAAKSGMVPTAPFVTDTKSWTALALKRMVAYAVENGFDSVAWTTGEQQAARYDLSKQVEAIDYTKTENGYYINVTANGTNVKHGDFTAAELEDIVGKEIVQKMGRQEGRHLGEALKDEDLLGTYELRGLDLKVGGEGMKGYYDGIVPQVANDVLKKIGGGKVGTVELRGGVVERINRDKVRVSLPDGTYRFFTSEQNAQEYIDRFGTAEGLEQPGFDITPAMREIVSTQGLPLFAGTPKKGSFSPATFELRLLADADLSTFLHEASHFFLAAYTDMAAQPGAPKALVDEVNAILGHLFKTVPGGAVAGGDLAQKVGAGETAYKAVDVESPEFKAWFGASKVVDADGKPLRVYHGTFADFEKFKRRTGDIGIHFGTAEAASDRIAIGVPHRANKEGVLEMPANVIPAYLAIRNPLRLADAGFWNFDNLETQLRKLFPDFPRHTQSTATIRAFIQSKGYDGIVYRNTGEVAGAQPFRDRIKETHAAMRAVFPKGKSSFDLEDQKVPEYIAWSEAERAYRAHRDASTEDSYIAFRPDQIKSAVANTGRFKGPNILEQDGPVPAPGPLPEGATPLDTWRGMSLDQQRPYHEAWAEQFEQYAMTGKAPSLELDSAFKTFANWLKKIYVSLKTFAATHTGGKLQPDTAAFFDRMLATEEQIATANAARSYTAMFKNAADAGMSDQKFADYMALSKEQAEDAEAMLRSRSLRDMAWLQRTRTKFIAGKQAEAADLRKAVRDEISKDLAATPLRQAARWLKKGEKTQENGTELKVTAGNKLQISEVEALFPEGALTPRPDLSKLGYGQYGMLANEGLSPDMVAEMFGYRSGEALVRDLLEMKPFNEEVESLTDTRMLEEHSEMLDPNAIAQAADAAIHNDARTRMVATELAALNNKIGSPAALMKAAKAYATQIIETKTSKTLKPWAFAAAETRAGKSALALLRKGKRDEAAEQKRVELVNHTAAKLAYQAEAELKKTIDRFKKIAGYKDDSSAIKSRDAEIVSAIRAILADFGIGTKGKTAREYLAVVQQHNPDLGDVLSDVIDSVAANAKDWREMKISELRDLSEEIEGLWFLAKRSKQIEIDGKLITLHEAQQAIYDRLDEIGIPDRVPGEGSAVTPAEKRGILFDRFVGALRRVESWVGAKDGTLTGPFRQYMWNPIRDAADAYRADKVKYLKAYRDLLAPVAPTFTRRLIDAPEIGYVFGKDEGGMGKTELLHAILHTGNESNKRKLLLGRGWATENSEGVLDTTKWATFVQRMHDEGVLTKADYDFAQGVWDLLESMKPLAQKAHRDVYGKYFSEVTANAFTNQFGTYAGGYVPAMTDPLIVRDQDLNRLREGEEQNMAYAFPTTAKGFTKGRVEYNKPLKLDLRTLSQHIDKVLLFAHMTRPVNDVRRVMSGKAVAQALGRVDPQAYNTLVMPWLNRAAKQVVETPTPGREGLGRFWSVVRARAGMAAMFANIANSVQQITGLSLAAVRVRPALLMASMAKYATGPKDFVEHVTSKSSYMQTRVENEVSAMSTQINEILLNPTVYESAKEWTQKHAYFMQSAVDNVISPVVWLAGYNQAIEQGLSEIDAVRAGDSAVRETQGSMAPEDIAAFETGSAFYRMFVQFAGYFNMNANLLGTEFVKLSRDMGLKKGAGRGLYVLTLGLTVPAIVGELIIQLFRGGPDDDDKDGEYLDDWLAAVFGYGPLRYVTAMVPGFGTVINAAVNTLNNKPYDDRISTAPAISMIESAVKAPQSVYKAIVADGKPSKAVKDVATLISMSVGLPASGLARPVSYLTDVSVGRVAPTGQHDLVRGTITGAASPASKQ